VLLSDIDGLYTADPNEIRTRSSSPKSADHAADRGHGRRRGSDMGSGGMQTKIAAAKIAVGRAVTCASPRAPTSIRLQRIEEGARCTWFVPSSTPVATRKQWIAGTLKPAGAIVVDDGAVRALLGGKSLLPAGVTARRGAIRSRRYGEHPRTRRLGGGARHLRVFRRDAARIIGRKSAEIERCLGFAAAMKSCTATTWC
jgi:glutamate 5-kinase